MSRPPDERRRTELLDRAVDFVLREGVADLSLRPLAKAIGSSPRVLLHYFGSKDELLAQIVRRGRSRQHATMAHLMETARLGPGELTRTLWREFSAPAFEPLMRLFLEVYALALQDRSRFPGFLESAVGDWIDALEGCATLPGFDRERARAYATLILAVFRGLLLDLCNTRDRARLDGAVELWLSLMESARNLSYGGADATA